MEELDPLLYDRLAGVLPKGQHFIFNHISTPPTPCDPIHAAPPGQKPEITFCETHFLSVSIYLRDRTECQVFGLEVLVFSTARLTTVFVSKVDSTGYLGYLNQANEGKGTFKMITSIFLRYLIEERQRPDKRLVLSIFARAAHEYLFRGSSESGTKNRLDDRRLITWWCQVVDAVLSSDAARSIDTAKNQEETAQEDVIHKESSQKDEAQDGFPQHAIGAVRQRGFLRVPGFDTRGTAAFFPKRKDTMLNPGEERWTVGDPLREMGQDPSLPPRCLIPRFPDDPKCRYLIDLDDELPDPEPEDYEKPKEPAHDGRWTSVKSLEDFWEGLAWRQECSAGRAVGFIWGLFEHPGQDRSLETLNEARSSQVSSNTLDSSSLAIRFDKDIQKQVPPQTRGVDQASSSSSDPATSAVWITSGAHTGQSVWCAIPHQTQDYYWPITSRGHIVMGSEAYNRIQLHLKTQDYDTKSDAERSTCNWLSKVADTARVSDGWGKVIVGRKGPSVITPSRPSHEPVQAAVTLGVGLIRKKPKRLRDEQEENKPVDEAKQELKRVRVES